RAHDAGPHHSLAIALKACDDVTAVVSDRSRNASSRIDARKLRVVENIEGFQTELDIPVLVRIAEVDLLEERKVGVVDARIPEVGALAQAYAADCRNDERVRVN